MKKIILFGDSLFNGYRNGQDTDAITNGLQKVLGNSVKVENLSKSGATTVEGLDYIKQIDPQADLVVLEYGTNDTAAGWGINSERYAKNLDKMVKEIGSNRMIIVGPSYPDPNNKEIMQDYSDESLDRYNAIAKECAQKYHIPFIDLIKVGRKLDNISSYYLADGQHLTDKENAILINTVAPVIKEKIEK